MNTPDQPFEISHEPIRVALLAAGLVTFTVVSAAARLVRGTIVDSASRRPVSGAPISVVGEQVPARSDDAGKFVLPAHRAAGIVMTVRRLGYTARTWTFAMTMARSR